MSNSRNLSRLIASGNGKLSNTNMSPGSTVQVVTNKDKTETNTTSMSFIALPLSVDITPKFTDSKILVFGHIFVIDEASGGPVITLYRNSNDIVGTPYGFGNIYSGAYMQGVLPFSLLDSPETSTLTTYRIWGRSATGNYVTFGSNGYRTNVITAIEIKS